MLWIYIYGLHKEQIQPLIADKASNMINTIEKLNQDDSEQQKCDYDDNFNFGRASLIR